MTNASLFSPLFTLSSQDLVRHYQQAIEYLLPVALLDTEGARVTAQVLLSAYNGDDYQLDITDLGRFGAGEDAIMNAILTVVYARARTGIKPQGLIDNGDALFYALVQRWNVLHASVRIQHQYHKYGWQAPMQSMGPEVLNHHYQQAVERLLASAQQETSLGRIAAQILLSAYDGTYYQWNIARLSLALDAKEELLSAILMVVYARACTGKGPQELIDDGDARFAALVTRWPQLSLSALIERLGYVHGQEVCHD
ncbi:hypothetical protein QCD60_29325 [Pokkaliibacter sp. MBI-7]|uniref:DUF7673 family protein n=1 Tax=Pokkaliibacter sp. MBI-7 TaxID=3040600 RepID=UPI002446C002|nr:hypothetical protein [Pokkaliibacter sp. MBI-7]MDH2434844.1 hypothetical protein [Pokkaliibacter sp. MBI-7]MDH2436619.1 hypothetical protein [Pokkaliibacter sp. MBI-7]